MRSSMDGTWYVYVLRCSDGTLYTGATKGVKSRLEKHQKGTASKYTRSRRPVKLVYSEPCGSKSMALRTELALKRMSRKDKEAYIRRPWKRER